MFPNEDAIIRLVGAILLAQNDEWALQLARYVTLETIASSSDDAVVGLPTVAIYPIRPNRTPWWTSPGLNHAKYMISQVASWLPTTSAENTLNQAAPYPHYIRNRGRNRAAIRVTSGFRERAKILI